MVITIPTAFKSNVLIYDERLLAATTGHFPLLFDHHLGGFTVGAVDAVARGCGRFLHRHDAQHLRNHLRRPVDGIGHDVGCRAILVVHQPPADGCKPLSKFGGEVADVSTHVQLPLAGTRETVNESGEQTLILFALCHRISGQQDSLQSADVLL